MTDTTVSPKAEAIDRSTRITHVLLGIVIGLGLLAVAASLTLGYFRFQDVASSAKVNCFGRISNARIDVVSQVTTDTASVDQLYNELVLQSVNRTEPDPALVARLAAANTKLSASVIMAQQLPSRDTLVAHGGTIGGKHYNAC